MELYKKRRPTKFKQVLGQDAACEMLEQMIASKSVPQALLFAGPSGCGKTTMARILKRELNCGDPDWVEMNAADCRGIDEIRGIKEKVSLNPLDGDCRIWLIDECHQLTSAAQNAFLKILEDTPRNAYFFLATTDPRKLLPTVRTRCTTVTVDRMTAATIGRLLDRMLKHTKLKKLRSNVKDAIVEAADGSARKALVLLEQIQRLKSTERQLEIIEQSFSEKEAIDLCRALVRPKNWPAVSKILRELKGEPEQTRRAILGYASAVLLKNPRGTARNALIIEELSDNLFDSGKPGLVAACYRICNG